MIKSNKTGVPPTAQEVTELEAKIGHKLPEGLVTVYSDPSIEFSYPNKFSFVTNEDKSGSIATIAPFSELAVDYNFFSEMYDMVDFLPFASDACGNFILADLGQTPKTHGHIFFFDFDTRELFYAASSVSDLIKKISCYSLKDLPEEEIQEEVISVSDELKREV